MLNVTAPRMFTASQLKFGSVNFEHDANEATVEILRDGLGQVTLNQSDVQIPQDVYQQVAAVSDPDDNPVDTDWVAEELRQVVEHDDLNDVFSADSVAALLAALDNQPNVTENDIVFRADLNQSVFRFQ